MKREIYYLLAFLFFWLGACASSGSRISKLENSKDTDVVFSVIDKTCRKNCSPHRCWLQSKELILCEVMFSATSPEDQVGYFKLMNYDLDEKGLKVGFCATQYAMAGPALDVFRGADCVFSIASHPNCKKGRVFFSPKPEFEEQVLKGCRSPK